MRYINGLIFNPILIDKHVSCSILYTANNFVQENLQCDSCEDLLSTAIARYREKWNFPKDRVSSNSLILWHIDWQESCRLHFINRIQCFVIPMITLSFDFMTFINGYHNQIELVILNLIVVRLWIIVLISKWSKWLFQNINYVMRRDW